jgi:hypothetical protein
VVIFLLNDRKQIEGCFSFAIVAMQELGRLCVGLKKLEREINGLKVA